MDFIHRLLLRFRSIFPTLLALPALLPAIPPPLPSAGVVEREIEYVYETRPFELKGEMPAVEVDIPEARLDMPCDATVFIRQVVIEDSSVIPDEIIQGWIQGFCEQRLTIADIYQICKTIDQNYATRGYFLARSYPPPQEIRDGVLVIKVLEGKIGNIRVEGNQFYSTSFIYRYFRPFCRQPIHYDEFLNALLLLNENSDLSAAVLFEKGEEVGTADLIVRVDDRRPVHLYLNENNYGRDLTTSSQFGGRLDYGNLIFQGDTLSVAEVVGFPIDALYFTDAIYSVPLNTKGAFMEVAYLFSKFKIREEEFLHLKGKSSIATIKGIQAIKRTKNLAIDVFGYFDYKQIQNYALGRTISFDKLRVITIGGHIDHFNSTMGRDYLNVEISAGIPSFLGGMSAVSIHSSRIGGGGRFVQLNLDYDHLHRVYNNLIFYFHASGQLSPSKLTLPQQIYIGGANTVRGYPMSVALGDSGYYANVEARFPLPIIADKRFFCTDKLWKEVLQFVTFLDTGGTFYNKTPRVHGSFHTNRAPQAYITGAGFGIRVLGPYNICVSLDVGFPLTRHDLSSGPFGYIKVTAQPF